MLLVRLRRRPRGLQYVTDETWIPELGIHYKLGVDGLNLFLIALTALLFVAPRSLWAALREWERPRLFYLCFGARPRRRAGRVLAQDLALFVLFFDLMLVPFYFLIGVWGGAATACGRRPSSSSTRWSARC